MLDNLRKCASYMTDEEFEQEVIEEKFTTTLSSGLEVELCPGGFSKKLEKYNLPEYIRLVVIKRLGEYEELMRHVREGVNFVIPFEIYNWMSWKMLEERATGTKTIDIVKLKSITSYTVTSLNNSISF
jgi:HECT-domain (ubiquitin-transferase)